MEKEEGGSDSTRRIGYFYLSGDPFKLQLRSSEKEI